MAYFLIRNSDGNTTVERIDPFELCEELENGDAAANFMSDLPKNTDTNYWQGALIIKGEIVAPEARETVTRYKMSDM
jgi:hypothetical protein